MSGSSDEVSYFTSLAYDDQLGTLPSNDLQRTNFRANFRATPNEKISVTANSGYVRSTINLPKSGNNTSGFFTNALTGIPLSSRNADGECLATVLAGVEPDFCDKNGNRRAAFDKIAAIISREKIERFTGSLQIDYTPVSWLTNSATLGTDIVDQVFNDAIPFDPDIPFSFAAGGEFFRTRNLFRNLTVDLSSRAAYDLTSSVGARTGIGAQYFQSTTEEIACEGRDFVNDQATACDAGVSLRGFSDLSEKVEIGAYLQQHLSYNDYLFLNGALRVDDNSALGANEPAIWSPSLNGSLVVSDLPMWNVAPGLVSDLRVRAAWGTATQSPVQYAAQRTFGIVRLGTDAGIVSGLSPEDPGNPDLGPERSSEIEVGFDAGVLDDRVGLQFTYFDRTTKDAIVLRPVAPSTGFADNQWVNLGELENKGYEASINALLLNRGYLTWDAVLTFASTKSTIVDLGDQDGFDGFYEGYAPGSLTSCVITSATRTADGEILNSEGELVGTVEHLPGTIDEGCE
ncbi:MAG: TonB-dependent receptor domain-containing protein, partial [Longimicrobiales bacterium]